MTEKTQNEPNTIQKMVNMSRNVPRELAQSKEQPRFNLIQNHMNYRKINLIQKHELKEKNNLIQKHDLQEKKPQGHRASAGFFKS